VKSQVPGPQPLGTWDLGPEDELGFQGVILCSNVDGELLGNA